jgi:tripartite-type tricarboxylate transporter receptor subunit TctC
MKLPRRTFLHLAAGAAALPVVMRVASALDYPTRPVRIIVGFAPGGGTDIIARLIGQPLAERLGQQFVIENRPGAGTNVATEVVVNAPPDGYTLLLACLPNASNATLYENLKFNFIRDITPVASISRDPFAIEVNPTVPVKTVPELIAHANANPGKINMASGGTGTVTHVAGEMFKAMAGVDMLHVPYRNDGAAITDLIGGRVQAYFVALAGAAEFIKAGKVRALGVTTVERSPVFPDIPTVGDFVPGYEASLRNGMGAPKATPADIIERLNTAINAGLVDPKLKAKFAELGSETAPLTVAQYAKVIVEETEKWGRVIRAANIKAE